MFEATKTIVRVADGLSVPIIKLLLSLSLLMLTLIVDVCPAVDEGEMGVRRFMQEVMTQWRSLSMEVRSVRSMLEEVLSNWEKYSSSVASLQAWLEDAEEALSQPENIRQV